MTNIQIPDVKSCFDKLRGPETSNDAFDKGIKNDKFILSSKVNSKCNVSIRMPWGKSTNEFQLNNI